MMMKLKPILLCLCGWMSMSADAADPDRFLLSQGLTLKAGEHVGRVFIGNGGLKIKAGSSAGDVRINNGNARVDLGSKLGDLAVYNGDITIDGKVTGDVVCGFGTLRISRDAEIGGQIVALACDLEIQSSHIDGAIVTYDGHVAIGPEIEIKQAVAFLDAVDRRPKNHRLPRLTVRYDTALTGGLLLDQCIDLVRGNRTHVQMRGIFPHEAMQAQRPTSRYRACTRMPEPVRDLDRAALSSITPVFLFEANPADLQAHLDQALGVGVGFVLPPDAQGGHLRTINTAIVLKPRAQARELEVVNGAIVLSPAAGVSGSVRIGNGELQLQSDATVQGDAEVLNGRISLAEGAAINGRATIYAGDVVLNAGAKLKSLHFARADDQDPTDQASELVLERADAIAEPIQLDRAIKIRVIEGPAPAWIGVPPEIKQCRRSSVTCRRLT